MARKTGGKRRTIAGLEYHHGRWRWRKRADGRRVTVPLAAKNEDEAIAEVLALRKRPASEFGSSWESFVDAYLATLGGNTADSRGPVLRAIGREMKLRTPRSLTPAVAERWLELVRARSLPSQDRPEPEIQPSTVFRYVRDLRALVKWALARRLIPSDPTATLEVRQPPERLRDVWVPAEQVAGLFQAARDAGDRDMEWILALGFECFMRRGEIDACRPEWFDLKLGILRIPPYDAKSEDGGEWKRKGREGRIREAVIPLSGHLLDLIRRHGLPAPFIVAPGKEWGEHRYRFEFRNRYGKFMAAHGLGHVTIHDMRRSAASNRVSAGVSIEKVANWMGIDYRTAWKRYSRFLPADADINRGSAGTVSAASGAPPSAAPVPDLKARLHRLEALHAEGLITAEERTAKRAAILAEI